MYAKRFILRNWLTQLWRLDVQNLKCGSASLWSRRASGADKAQRQANGELSLTQGGWSFCSIHSFNLLERATHIIEGNLLYLNKVH